MILSIEEFEKIFKEENLNWDGNKSTKKQKSIELDGKQVYLRSHRYKLFLEQGYVCKCCGAKNAKKSLILKRADSFLEALLLKEPWHGSIWEKISY